MIYTGDSMIPTFEAGDELRVVPYGKDKVKIGDVVVFRYLNKTENVVHRVVSILSSGIRTRGDNNTLIDEEIIHIENILGRVVGAKRGTKMVRVYNGIFGEVYLFILKAIKFTKRITSIALHPIYDRLSRAYFVKILLPDRYRPKVFCFQRPNGPELQLRMGKKIIGRCDAKSKGWEIKKPYKLLVNTPSLPTSSPLCQRGDQ